MQNTDCKPVETECPNCHQKILAWRDPNGVAKWVCPRCRTKTVSKVMGRRHINLDIIGPEGQVLII